MDASDDRTHQQITRGPDLHDVADLCRKLVAEIRADGASVSIRADTGISELVHATNPLSEELAELQIVLGEGPAQDVHRTATAATSNDLQGPAALHRWPGFASEAAAAGVGAVLTVPLQVSSGMFGCSEFYRSRAEAITITAAASQLLSLLADTILTLHSHIDDGYRPGYRPDLNVAIGMTSIHLGVSVAVAADLLNAAAFSEHRTLQHLAHDIVTGTRRLRLE